MAYTKTTLSKAIKRKRVRIPRFEKTEECRRMQKDLEGGLKPGEALQMIFLEDDQKKYRITNRRTVARYIVKYLAAHKMLYRVRSFQIPGGFTVQVDAGGHGII